MKICPFDEEVFLSDIVDNAKTSVPLSRKTVYFLRTLAVGSVITGQHVADFHELSDLYVENTTNVQHDTLKKTVCTTCRKRDEKCL